MNAMNEDVKQALLKALSALQVIDPYVDQLVDYGSTASEWPLNLAPQKVADAISSLEEVLERHLSVKPSKSPKTSAGEVAWAAGIPNSIREVVWRDGLCPEVGTKVYVHPTPETVELEGLLKKALSSRDFYRRRCDLLQGWQSKMRDPERTIVCDILANGQTLPPGHAGDRYKVPAVEVQSAGLPIAWTLAETLQKKETTTKGYLWFSDPQNCMWSPLYANLGVPGDILRDAMRWRKLEKSGFELVKSNRKNKTLWGAKASFTSYGYDLFPTPGEAVDALS